MEERYRCLNGGLCLARAGAGNARVCSCRSPWCGRTCSKQIPNCIEEGELYNLFFVIQT